MTLDSLLNCAAPLVFSDPDGENPFFGGTCFRANLAGRIFVITASHCLTNRHVNIATIRVECATPELTYLPLKAWHLFGTVSREDTSCADIAIFEVDSDRMRPEEIACVPALDVEKCPPPPELKVGSRLLAPGISHAPCGHGTR